MSLFILRLSVIVNYYCLYYNECLEVYSMPCTGEFPSRTSESVHMQADLPTAAVPAVDRTPEQMGRGNSMRRCDRRKALTDGCREF